MATIGSLQVNLVATTANFAKGMKSAQSMMSGFVDHVRVGAAAVTAAFGGMLKMFESTGSQLHDLSVATGMTVENLSFLKFAAEQSGAGLDNVTKAARNLQKNGIDPNQFNKIAASIAAIKDPTQRAQAAFEAFGAKSGAALLPMLNDLPALQQRFTELGGEFTNKMAKAADALGDSFGELKLALSGVTNTIAEQLAPAITKITTYLADNTAGIRKWVDEHPGWIKAIVITAGSLTLIAAAMIAVEKASIAATKAMALFQAAKSHPKLALAIGAGLGGYGLYKYFNQDSATSTSGTAPGASKEAQTTAAKATEQVELTKEQNELLKIMAGQRPVQLGVAGVR